MSSGEETEGQKAFREDMQRRLFSGLMSNGVRFDPTIQADEVQPETVAETPKQPSITASALEAKCWSLIGELRQNVKWLTRENRTRAMVIMAEVSTFETDWWGSHPTPTTPGDTSWFEKSSDAQG